MCPPYPFITEHILVSVCPVTGETIGHNLPTPETVTNTDPAKNKKAAKADPEPAKSAISQQEKIAKSEQEAEAPTVQEKKDANEVKGANTASANCSTVTTDPECSPAATAANVPAIPAVETASFTAVISSQPAAVKTRRVPPGGHTTALW